MRPPILLCCLLAVIIPVGILSAQTPTPPSTEPITPGDTTGSAVMVRSEKFTPWSFGAIGGFGMRIFDGTLDIGASPEVGNGNCGILESGNGRGALGGVSIEFRTSDKIAFGLRGLYETSGISISGPAPGWTDYRRNDGSLTPVESEYVMLGTLNVVAIEPYILFHPIEIPIAFGVGAKVAVPTTDNYTLSEEISTPRDVTFDNGTAIRRFGEGLLQTPIRIGAMLSAHYELPISRTLSFRPGIALWAYPQSILPEGTIREFGAHAAASIIYNIPVPAPPPPPPPPIIPPVVSIPEASIRAYGLTANRQPTDSVAIHYDLRVSTRRTVLLPYIFFDSGSAKIPERYFANQASHEDALMRYRRILPLIGNRMAANTSTHLQLVGTTSGESEGASGQLALERARSVKNYLVERWSVDPERIEIESRVLPKLASNRSTAAGDEENRRVEIGGDPELLAPITTADTIRTFASEGILYEAEIASEAGIASWEITMFIGGRVARKLTSALEQKSIADGLTTTELARLVSNGGPIGYSLRVLDKAGTERVTGVQTISIDVDTTISDEALVRNTPVTLGESIFFDYNSARLRPESDSMIARIRRERPNGARLIIAGFADETGDAEQNRRLSMERARAVAARFNDVEIEIEAHGSDMLLFPNNTPEGRFLSRTVRITIVPTRLDAIPVEAE